MRLELILGHMHIDLHKMIEFVFACSLRSLTDQANYSCCIVLMPQARRNLLPFGLSTAITCSWLREWRRKLDDPESAEVADTIHRVRR